MFDVMIAPASQRVTRSHLRASTAWCPLVSTTSLASSGNELRQRVPVYSCDMPVIHASLHFSGTPLGQQQSFLVAP